ncbi:MAG: peptidoglycan-binding protein [Terracidiphilus sp.]
MEFGIDLDQKHYDLPQFLVQKVLAESNLPDVLNKVEPKYLGYQRTETALQTYLALETQDHSQPLPDMPKTVKSGDAYSSVQQLGDRLRLLGDLPQSAVEDPNATTYSEPLVEAVKHFQARHGLKSEGRLDKETIAQLNMPLSARVIQLEDSLERWRWLPADYPQLPVAVNIPGFKLRVFSDDHTIALRMNVVVGKALNHQTPVFAKEMKYIIFRPLAFWFCPTEVRPNATKTTNGSVLITNPHGPNRSLVLDRSANDSNGASGSTSYRLRNAAQQEVMNAPLPMRTDRYQIGAPFGRLAENCVCHVSNPYASLCRESGFAQFGRNPLNQDACRLLFIFQFRCITLSHLRRRHGVNRLQDM